MKLLRAFFGAALMVVTLAACAQKAKKQSKVPEHLSAKELSKYSQATFAAGCFWHEEALFESIKGVKEAISGYAGGSTKNPGYESIENGNTGHAETVNIYYDSSVITYPTLLKIYFAGQNPTQVNGQGNDVGTQYRSIIFYRNSTEKQLAENYIKGMQASGKFNGPITAQLMPLTRLWEAEKYHQNYIENNPNTGYVQHVSVPEIIKVQKEFPQLIKPDHVF